MLITLILLTPCSRSLLPYVGIAKASFGVCLAVVAIVTAANVHKWAQSMGGGGHRNASGAFVNDTLDEVRRSVVKSAPKYLDFESRSDDDLDPEDAEYLSSLMDMNTRTPHS